ncbi:DUF2510 domain-containing protein [Cumulibacter manganitolerans]|uniref:DUF2510 domain-containing protein n=1 Tax=Cumulibacter manganitolerans TaxID=1884992 RepID=UPI001295A169|nr:DUF2510 domain-containing protein [Cumulibacter manganitolerans]
MSTPGQPSEHDPADEQYEVVVPDRPMATHSAHWSGAAPGGPGGRWSDPYGPPPDSGHPVRAGHRTEPSAYAEWADAPTRPPRARGGLPTGAWWGIGGLIAAALVVVLLVVTGVFSATDEEDPGANNNATGQYSAPSVPNSKLRIVDKDSGVSYDYLGEGWKDWQMGVMAEYSTTVGEFIVTQPTIPGGGEFIAQVTSGLLSSQFPAAGPSSYPSVLADVEQSVRGNYYPQPNKPTNEAAKALTVDGHAAYQRSMDLTWDVEGYDSTGERVVLLLIDTGKSAPVFFYCSFPNTHAELYPLIEQVIASIKVDQ